MGKDTFYYIVLRIQVLLWPWDIVSLRIHIGTFKVSLKHMGRCNCLKASRFLLWLDLRQNGTHRPKTRGDSQHKGLLLHLCNCTDRSGVGWGLRLSKSCPAPTLLSAATTMGTHFHTQLETLQSWLLPHFSRRPRAALETSRTLCCTSLL